MTTPNSVRTPWAGSRGQRAGFMPSRTVPRLMPALRRIRVLRLHDIGPRTIRRRDRRHAGLFGERSGAAPVGARHVYRLVPHGTQDMGRAHSRRARRLCPRMGAGGAADGGGVHRRSVKSELTRELDDWFAAGALRADERVAETVAFIRNPPLHPWLLPGYRVLFEALCSASSRGTARCWGCGRRGLAHCPCRWDWRPG